jgi:hypothetical protein
MYVPWEMKVKGWGYSRVCPNCGEKFFIGRAVYVSRADWYKAQAIIWGSVLALASFVLWHYLA